MIVEKGSRIQENERGKEKENEYKSEIESEQKEK